MPVWLWMSLWMRLLRNEVALGVYWLLDHCRSPHVRHLVVDRGFPAERWDSLRDALLGKDGPN